MDIGRIVREFEVLPADEPDRAPLVEPDPQPSPDPEPSQAPEPAGRPA